MTAGIPNPTTEAQAFEVGKQAALEGLRLNKTVAAPLVGYKYAGQLGPQKTPGYQLWLAFEQGYLSVSPGSKPGGQYKRSDFIEAAELLAANGQRLSWKALCSIVGCGRSTAYRFPGLEQEVRVAYDFAKHEAQVAIDPLPKTSNCGRCIRRMVPAEQMQKFENTPALCPECAEAYLEAVRRDEGVLAA